MHKKLFKIQNNNDYITVIDIERFKKQLAPKESCIVLCDDCKINNENITITFLNRTFIDFGDTVVENTNGVLGDKVLISDLLKKENDLLQINPEAKIKEEIKKDIKEPVKEEVKEDIKEQVKPIKEQPKRGRKPKIQKEASPEVKER